MRIYAVIPAYQPTACLLSLVRELQEGEYGEIFDEIIVVNDGSSSETIGLFSQLPSDVTLFHHAVNSGKGQALKTAFSYILEKTPSEELLQTYIVTLDDDGQHLPADAVKLLHLAQQHPEALILGKRDFSHSAPFRSRLGNALMRTIFKLRTGIKLYDTQTGLRAFSADILDLLLDTEGSRYEYETNVLLHCAENEIPFIEEPIATIYDGKARRSHYKTFTDSLRIAKELFKFASSSFSCFLVDYFFYSLFLLTWSANNIAYANFVARAISSVLNFNINRKLVFKSKSPLLPSAVKFFTTVIVVITLNTLLLEIITANTGLSPYVAKIFVEGGLFIVSWTLQRFLVFPTMKNKPSRPAKQNK